MKRLMCLIILAFLFALLLLPPFLRRFANFNLEKVSAKGSEDKVTVLNCQKDNEKLNTSYLNGKTYNIQYKLSGDYRNATISENDLLKDFQSVSKMKYDSKKNMTTYKIDATNNNVKNDYLLGINEQKMYYERLGFICSSIN